MDTCQPAEGLHRIPKGSERCLCGRTSRTFPDPRAFDAWKRLWDSVAEPPVSAPATPPLIEPLAPAAAAPEPQPAASAAEAPAVVEPLPAVEPAPARPAPKKGRSKPAPSAP